MTRFTATFKAADKTTGVAASKTGTFSVTTSAAVVGATVNPSAYGTSDYLSAANTYDGFVARPMAVTAQKWYFTSGSFPSSVPAGMKALAGAGCAFLISFKPSQTLSTAQQNALASACALLTAGGINYAVTLSQEPNVGSNFPSAAAYKAYAAFYQPTLAAAGIKHVYDPALCSPGDKCNAQSVLDFYPGDAVVDGGVALDYYCSSWKGGTTVTPAIAALADGNAVHGPLPLWLGEWGGSASSSYTPSAADWSGYTTYLAGLFGGRASSGLANGDLLYFNGPGAATQPNNLVSGPTDLKVGGIQALYDALA